MKYPNRVIKQGEKDSKIVTAIQKRLMAVGTDSFTTFGEFGPKTVAAVKLFQSMHRDQNGNPLEIDGKLGSITWAALFGIEEVPVTNTSTKELLTEVIKVARSQIGVMEKPPGSNKGPEVNEYLLCVDCPPPEIFGVRDSYIGVLMKQQKILIQRIRYSKRQVVSRIGTIPREKK